MASIEKRVSKDGDISYRVAIRIKGTPKQTATFSSLTRAKDWAQRTEVKIRDGKYLSEIESKKHTLSEVVQRYKEYIKLQQKTVRKDWIQQLDWWDTQIGFNTLANITPALISKQRDILLSEKNKKGNFRKPATVNRYLAVLSIVLSLCVKEWQLIEINPVLNVKKLKEPKGRVRYLSKEERYRLLEECYKSDNPYLFPAVVLALSSGARRMEVLSLKWKRIDFSYNRAVLENTKNGETRIISIQGKVKDLILELYNDRGSLNMFFLQKMDSSHLI